MKKLLSILVLATLTMVAVNAQKDAVKKEVETVIFQGDDGKVVETSQPIFQFNEESYDFGEIPEGEKYTHEFTFVNIGKEPLIVKGVKASCGCTTPNWPKEPIMPGETGIITATYNSKGRPGNFNKAITITSNAVTPTKRLFIKGTVLRDEAPVAAPEKPKSIVNEKAEE